MHLIGNLEMKLEIQPLSLHTAKVVGIDADYHHELWTSAPWQRSAK